MGCGKVIVLDTHAWIWRTIQSNKLSQKARREIKKAVSLLVPAICTWEVAMFVEKGRLALDRDVQIWIKQALSLGNIRLEPLTPAIAVRSTRLPGELSGDPADRMIVATAMEFGAPLVTCDKRILKYPHIRTIW